MKKIFYRKKYGAPPWSQVYILWGILFLCYYLILNWQGTIEPITRDSNLVSFDPVKSWEEADKNTKKYQWQIKQIDSNKPEHFNRLVIQKNWDSSLISFGTKEAECSRYRIHNITEGIKTLHILFAEEENVTGLLKSIYVAIASSPTIKNTRFEFHVLSDPHRCTNNLEIKSITNDSLNPHWVTLLPQENRQNPTIRFNSYQNLSSSVYWYNILPEHEKGGEIFEMILDGAFPLLQSPSAIAIRENIPAVTWYYHFKDDDPTLEIQNRVSKLQFLMRSFDQSDLPLDNTGYHITREKALSTTQGFFLAIFLVIFSWLPLANWRYREKSPVFIIRGIISAIYCSIPLAVFFLMVKTAGNYGLESRFFTPGSFLFSLLLFMVLRKYQNHLFNLNTNPISAYIILQLLGSLIAFSNLSLYLFLIPPLMLASKKEIMNRPVFAVAMFVTFLPLMVGISNTVVKYSESTLQWLSPLHLSGTVFSETIPALVCALFFGSLIQVVLCSKK